MRIDPRAVFGAVRAIPAGTVVTYGKLAERVGLTKYHARAIGSVLASRPENAAWMTDPPEDHDVPWWRVFEVDGSLLADEDENSRDWIR